MFLISRVVRLCRIFSMSVLLHVLLLPCQPADDVGQRARQHHSQQLQHGQQRAHDGEHQQHRLDLGLKQRGQLSLMSGIRVVFFKSVLYFEDGCDGVHAAVDEDVRGVCGHAVDVVVLPEEVAAAALLVVDAAAVGHRVPRLEPVVLVPDLVAQGAPPVQLGLAAAPVRLCKTHNMNNLAKTGCLAATDSV